MEQRIVVVKDTKFEKDVQAVLDFGFDWSQWLSVGETISTATVTVPTGITKDSQSNTTDTVTVWLSGGTAGIWYDVTCKIVTSVGRTDRRTIQVLVTSR